MNMRHKQSIRPILLITLFLSCTNDNVNVDNPNNNEELVKLKSISSDIIFDNDFDNLENSVTEIVFTLSQEQKSNEVFRNNLNNFIAYSEKNKSLNRKIEKEDFKYFGISDEAISILLLESEKIERYVNNINKNHLNNLRVKEKELFNKYFIAELNSEQTLNEKSKISNMNFDESDPCCPGATCCGTYKKALEACLDRAGYDWWIVLNSGLYAFWNSIQAYERAKKCIDEAEMKYYDCCRKK